MLSALRSRRGAVILLVAQIALTLAVLCNLVFIVSGSWQRAETPTGVPEQDIGLIQSIGVIGMDDGTEGASVGRSLAALQSVPGVVAAAFGSAPLWNAESASVFAKADATQPLARPYLFYGSQGLQQVFDVRIVSGRGLDEDLRPTVADIESAIKAGNVPQLPGLITPSLARRLFGDASPLGQQFYTSIFGNVQVQLTVVGVMSPLHAAISGHDDDTDVMLTEMQLAGDRMGGGYVLRSQPGQLAQVLPLAAAAMRKVTPDQVQNKVLSLSAMRERYFAADRASARLLLAIIVILLVVTALGIFGLSSFWVSQRQRQIGVRRALGARRRDILRYFLAENLLISAIGVALGICGAIGLNLWLSATYEIPRMAPLWLVIGAGIVLLLGQCAVLPPARRAARVPPVVATRAV